MTGNSPQDPPEDDKLDERQTNPLSDLDQNTRDISDEKALLIVEQLMERGIIHMSESTPLLIHKPSGQSFESATNLAHYHKGWEAARKDNHK